MKTLLVAEDGGVDYSGFRKRYWSDPGAFARECIVWPDGDVLAGYQAEVLDALVAQRRVSVRAPHGAGKSALSAIAILWFALTRDGSDWKIITTASAWRQLTRYLWPEIHKWARRLDWSKIGRDALDLRRELLALNLHLSSGEASAAASNNEAYIEGAHADHLLYVFDEAKAIPAPTFDAAEGAFSGAGSDTGREAYALAISTPGEPVGRFYDLHRRVAGTENWHVRHITLAEAVAAGRVSQEWAEQMARLWGVSSAQYQNRVLGEFAANDEDGVIPVAWIEAAQDRWREMKEAGELGGPDFPPCTAVALDVADGGADRSIMAIRHGHVLAEVRDVTAPGAGATMSLVGKVAGVVQARGGVAVVDSVGVGAGVVSRLREQQIPCRSFNAGAAAKDSRGRPLRDGTGELTFVNVRAAAHWRLRELLDPETGADLALYAGDEQTADGQGTVADRMLSDLATPHWRVDSSGRIAVEGKDDLRKPARLGRSTDYGDAVLMAFWPAASPLTGGVATGRGDRIAGDDRAEMARRRRPETAGIRNTEW